MSGLRDERNGDALDYGLRCNPPLAAAQLPVLYKILSSMPVGAARRGRIFRPPTQRGLRLSLLDSIIMLRGNVKTLYSAVSPLLHTMRFTHIKQVKLTRR